MSLEIKVAISYRFTGVSPEELENVSLIAQFIKEKVDGVFCSLDCEPEFQKQKMNADAIYQYCLDQFKSCNAVVAFIAHEQGSTGMLKELQLAKEHNMPVYLIIKRGLEFQDFRRSARQLLEFDDISEIPSIINSLSFLRK